MTNPMAHSCSLYRVTELLSKIKYGNRGEKIILRMNFGVVDHFLPKQRKTKNGQTSYG